MKLLTNIRSAVLVFLTHRLALPVLKLVRKEERFPFTMAQLHEMPAGTLGHDLFDFLNRRQLQLLPYYARHDMKHILLGYDTTDEGEGCLQCFMLGNGHLSFPVLATVAYCGITMPGHWGAFRKAYARGRRSAHIADWNWFAVVTEETQLLREKIGLA